VTGFNIDFSASITAIEWDEKYKMLCAQSDELIMIADLHIGEMRPSAQKLYEQMNLYWGNFKMVLNMTAAGQVVSHSSGPFLEAHKYAMMIPGVAQDIKTLAANVARKTQD
jgi:hypothetical protein